MLNILGNHSSFAANQESRLNIDKVIHGYVQSAATVAGNTRALKEALSDIANLHYVDGPPRQGSGSRPWWILDQDLEHDMTVTNRWDDVVCTPGKMSATRSHIN